MNIEANYKMVFLAIPTISGHTKTVREAIEKALDLADMGSNTVINPNFIIHEVKDYPSSAWYIELYNSLELTLSTEDTVEFWFNQLETQLKTGLVKSFQKAYGLDSLHFQSPPTDMVQNIDLSGFPEIGFKYEYTPIPAKPAPIKRAKPLMDTKRVSLILGSFGNAMQLGIEMDRVLHDNSVLNNHLPIEIPLGPVQKKVKANFKRFVLEHSEDTIEYLGEVVKERIEAIKDDLNLQKIIRNTPPFRGLPDEDELDDAIDSLKYLFGGDDIDNEVNVTALAIKVIQSGDFVEEYSDEVVAPLEDFINKLKAIKPKVAEYEKAMGIIQKTSEELTAYFND